MWAQKILEVQMQVFMSLQLGFVHIVKLTNTILLSTCLTLKIKKYWINNNNRSFFKNVLPWSKHVTWATWHICPKAGTVSAVGNISANSKNSAIFDDISSLLEQDSELPVSFWVSIGKRSCWPIRTSVGEINNGCVIFLDSELVTQLHLRKWQQRNGNKSQRVCFSESTNKLTHP